jgi:hypothetical protein
MTITAFITTKKLCEYTRVSKCYKLIIIHLNALFMNIIFTGINSHYLVGLRRDLKVSYCRGVCNS